MATLIVVWKGRFFLLGLIIGAASGVLQFWLLSKFTAVVTDGNTAGGKLNNKMVLFAVSQFLLPLLVLLGCALLLFDGLLWAGAGMAASLIICAAARFLISRRQR